MITSLIGIKKRRSFGEIADSSALLRAWFARGAGTIAAALLLVLFGGLFAAPAGAATEECNGVDDDGDGVIDNGFFTDPQLVDGVLRCVFHQDNACTTWGYAVCTDTSTGVCQQGENNPILQYADETLANGNCNDGKDNDCDGNADLDDDGCQSAEVCDGQDNDGDGVIDNGFLNGPTGLGQSCTAGIGACLDNGVYVCTADHTGTECSAKAGNPKPEKLANGTCNDGIDNDCNGFTDAADTSCQVVSELCNYIDDNNNGLIDEGFGVGQGCTTGVGACAAMGALTCLADGTGTECDATPGSPGQEGDAYGNSCSDGIDNDCDGLTDAADDGCTSGVTSLGVYCALPFNHGKPGKDCTGKHEIQFGANPGVTVVADLVALDSNGQVMDTIPDVKSGEEVHLASRVDPEDYKVKVRNVKGGARTYEVFAPLPQLRVTATQNGETQTAYCTNVPYLQVTNPKGIKEISLSEGSTVAVEAAIPLVDVNTLFVKVDGVDVLNAIGIDPAPKFPGGPYCGHAGDCVFQVVKEVGGVPTNFDVEVRDLVVNGLDSPDPDSAVDGIGDPARNVLSFKLMGLPPGGHIVFVDGEPLPFAPVTSACLVDDIADKGQISTFGITIEKPEAQAQVAAPVEVKGEARSGVQIARLLINGGPVDVSSQQFTLGDGENTADEWVLAFDEHRGLTDLTMKQAGTAPLGTFDPGSNELVADGTTVGGTRAFARRIFATGDVAPPAALQQFYLDAKDAINQQWAIAQTNMATEIPNSFVVGLQEQGAADFFQAKCNEVIDQFTSDVSAALQNATLGTVDIKPTCAPDLIGVPVVLDSVTFPGTRDCTADFVTDQININVDLPDVVIQAHARKTKQTNVLGVCASRSRLNVSATLSVKDLGFHFALTEGNIENLTPPTIPDDAFTFTQPTEANGGLVTDFDDTGIECVGGAICNFFVGFADFALEVFTFGLIPDDFITLGSIGNVAVADFEDLLGTPDPDPMQLREVKPNPDAIQNIGQSAYTAELDDVEIVDGGLTVAIKSSFSTPNPDPSVPATPGAVLTPAAVPTPLQLVNQQGGEISLLVADDVFNQFFASLAQTGALKTQCNSTGVTVGDLLPDCATLVPPVIPDTIPPDGVAALQGLCYGVKTVSTPDCESVTDPDLYLQAVKQGACHGVRNDNCLTLPTTDPFNGAAEGIACGAVQLVSPGGLHIEEDDGLVACAGEAIPPRLVFNPNSSGGEVFTDLFLQDLSVSFVLDREDNGFAGDLATAKNCFAEGGNLAPDCKLYEACLDLTLKTSMALDNTGCQAGETGFRFAVDSVIPSGLESGVVCSAANAGDDSVVTQESAQDSTVDEVAANAEMFAPPVCAQGLDLGGVLDFSQGKLFTVTTTGSTPFADYLGITGDLNE